MLFALVPTSPPAADSAAVTVLRRSSGSGKRTVGSLRSLCRLRRGCRSKAGATSDSRSDRPLAGFHSTTPSSLQDGVGGCLNQVVRVQVQKNGDGDDRLPTAYTCFHLLLLPKYTSPDVLRQRLLQAISETQGFGLS